MPYSCKATNSQFRIPNFQSGEGAASPSNSLKPSNPIPIPNHHLNAD